MIEITINTEHAMRRIAEMQGKLHHLPDQMGDELYNWEAEDLGRRAPWVARKGKRAFTYIQQHSIREMRRSIAARQAARKQHHRGPQHTSTRPILRESLLEKLVSRMAHFLQDNVKW